MKKAFISLLLFSQVINACKDGNVPTEKSDLFGQWLQTEYLNDPGNGSGTWQKPSPNSYEVISFRRDYVFVGGDGQYNLFPGYISFRIRSDSTLTLYKTSHADSLRLRISLTSKTLEIDPPCIERCGMRFSKITNY